MNDLSGLFSKNSEPIPLMGVSVKGDILGRGARVKIAQRFRNKEDKAIEAVYKFPLPENASICGFRALIDGRKIEGSVEEREKAFKIYDDALSHGHGGYLLDEERPNIFTLSVGNLKPGSEAVIEIEYVILLDMEGPRARFYLPTTISPRYISDRMPERDGIPEGEKVSPVYAMEVPYGLSLALDIHEGRLIETVESATHPISVEIGREPIRVSFSSDSVKMDRDFILYMGYKESSKSRAYRYQSGEDAFYQLDMVLGGDEKQAGRDSEKEIIFVLDCSGSMDGDSIRESKKALEICLKGMDKNTVFNIYRFGNTFQSLFKQAQRYSEKTLKQALNYLSETQADLGGTEVLAPLKHIYGKQEDTSLFRVRRNIVLLTDGEVGNEQEVFNLVRENRDHTRFFPVGIGAGPNELFIKGTARAGKGGFEFIHPGERIEPKVLRIFQKIGQGGVENVVVKWGDGSWEQAPQDQMFFPGSPVTLFAKGKSSKDLPEKFLEIKGKINDQGKEWRIEVAQLEQERNCPIPVFWARERIRDLEEMGKDTWRGGSRQAERKSKQTNEMILDLSKRYGLLSILTSFVAVEEREEKDRNTGEIVLRKVPTLVTVGWHGMPRGAAARLSASFPSSVRDVDYGVVSSLRVAEPLSSQKRVSREERRIDVLMEILSRQRAEGGLELTPKISHLLHIDFEEIRDIASDTEFGVNENKFLIVSTAMLLLVLETYFMDQESSWGSVVYKSRKWLEEIIQKGHPRIRGEELMEWIEGYVKTQIRF